MAERVGFEPTIRFPVCSLSRRVLSTTQSPLRGGCKVNRSRALELGAMRHTTPSNLKRILANDVRRRRIGGWRRIRQRGRRR